MSEQNAPFNVDFTNETKNNYSIVPNALLRDHSVSPNCRWLIAYLCSNAPTWRINARQLINHCKDFLGRDQVYGIINEAINAGYLLREETTVKGLKRISYLVSSDKRFKKSLPLPENQDAAEQDAVVQGTKEVLSFKNENIEEKKTNARARDVCVKEKPVLLERGAFVKISQKDLDLLYQQHGESLIDGIINEMNDYLLSTGKKPYSDYAATIRNWIRRNGENQKNIPKNKESLDKKYTEDLQKIFGHHKDLAFGANYIEFNFGPMNKPHLKFGDNGFREQCENNLRKMGLKF